MTLDLRALFAVARRHCLSPEEAEDLVQAALLAALEAGMDPSQPGWMRAVIRNLGARHARTAGRRRAREAAIGPVWAEVAEVPAVPDPDGLPPALARTARLVGAGCTRKELAWLLRIRDETLRQRLTALRKVARPSVAPPALTDAPGPARQALLGHPALQNSVLGTQDPDGHLFFVGVLTKGAPAGT